jgi:hypothetical protein
VKDQLQMAIRQMSDFEKLKGHIEMTVTTDGLRIELSESATGTFFDSGVKNRDDDEDTKSPSESNKSNEGNKPSARPEKPSAKE